MPRGSQHLLSSCGHHSSQVFQPGFPDQPSRVWLEPPLPRRDHLCPVKGLPPAPPTPLLGFPRFQAPPPLRTPDLKRGCSVHSGGCSCFRADILSFVLFGAPRSDGHPAQSGVFLPSLAAPAVGRLSYDILCLWALGKLLTSEIRRSAYTTGGPDRS